MTFEPTSHSGSTSGCSGWPAHAYLGLADQALVDQCTVHAYRASGPGGQKRNKTSSAIRLHHGPSGLIVQAEEDRSQHINRRRALKRLRMALATQLLQPIDAAAYEPSAALRAHISEGRLQVRLRDPDALQVINEVLTLLSAVSGRISVAAEHLGATTASVAKLLEIDDHVWRKANDIRKAHGNAPLKPRQR